jgi:hypothetical protein
MLTFTEPTITRQVFEAWSIAIPVPFAETFVHEDSYWHAWDQHRSVSLSSITLTDRKGRPATESEVASQFPRVKRAPVDEMPPGLSGRAEIVAVKHGRASQALSGLLAAPGRALVVTITSDDLAWARTTWLSIRTYAAPISSRAERRAARLSHGSRHR